MQTPEAPTRPVALRNPWTGGILLAAILATTILGLHLRLEDPLATRAIVAEDPYTHMALVREHAADGNIESLNTGESLYPPGLHTVVAATWALTGLPLDDLARILPAVFGALSILGIAILLWRWVGPVSATVGALVLAVAPEAILRTTMLSPTALDLAILPFLLLALLEVLTGRLAWLAAAVPLAAFLVFSHPWLFTILAIAGILFLALCAAAPWPAARGRLPTGVGIAAAWAVLGLGVAAMLWGCNGTCGVGLRDIVPGGEQLAALAPVLAGLSLLPALLVTVRRGALDWLAPQRVRDTPRRRDRAARTTASIWLAILLAIGTLPAMQIGLPPHVDLLQMVGLVVLALAATAFVLLPFLSSPAAQAGAALAGATYPFVMYDPLHSPFWSHRTAVYFAFACALLAGVAAAALARLLTEAWTIHVHRKAAARSPTPAWERSPAAVAPAAVAPAAVAPATSRPPPRSPDARTPAFSLRRAGVLAVPALLVALSISGVVYAQSPEPYDWYRLYGECEYAALADIAARAEADPDAVVITGTWQAKLVLAALSTDAKRIWFSDSALNSQEQRAGIAAAHDLEGRPTYIVLDPHLPLQWAATPHDDLGSPTWPEEQSWCTKGGQPTIRLYIHSGDPT